MLQVCEECLEASGDLTVFYDCLQKMQKNYLFTSNFSEVFFKHI